MKRNSIHKRRRLRVVLLTIGLLLVGLVLTPRVLIMSGHAEFVLAILHDDLIPSVRGLSKVGDFRKNMTMSDAMSIIEHNEKWRLGSCGCFIGEMRRSRFSTTNNVYLLSGGDPNLCLVRDVWRLSYDKRRLFVDLKFEGDRISEMSVYGMPWFV